MGCGATGRKQEQHKMFYWEYARQRAVRQGNWKAIQNKSSAPWELYDLANDISETTDISARRPDILAAMKDYAEKATTKCIPGTYSDPKQTLNNKDRSTRGSR